MPGLRRFMTGVAVLGVGVVAALPVSTVARAATAPQAATAATAAATAATGANSSRPTNVRNRRTSDPWPNLAPAGTVKKAAAALTIEVDNTPPPGRNWEYTHYFPEMNVTVAPSSTVDFHWNPGSQDGRHSVTFPGSMTEAAYRAANPMLVADNGAGEASTPDEAFPIVPIQFLGPSGAPPGCGFGPTPCLYDGATPVHSGVIPNSTGVDFMVTLPATPGPYTYFCLFHPGMRSTITVGPTATTPAQAAAQAKAEYDALNITAQKASDAASNPTSVTNPDGTKTWTVNVGMKADDVEILEMLPANLAIKKGDTVHYVSLSPEEIHTATFLSPSAFSPTAPAGADFAPFLPPVCEGAPATNADTPAARPANGPPFAACPPPPFLGYEQPVNPAPQPTPAVHSIPSGNTSASSGIITSRAGVSGTFGSAGPSYDFKFPNNGTFLYFCHFHKMGGVVNTPGYRMAGKDGGVFDFGGMDFFGSKGGPGSPNNIVAIIDTFDGQGYWLIGANGAVYNFGDAQAFKEDLTKFKLNAPIVAAALTSDGGGLFLIGADGGVFTLGNATFMGSTGSQKLNQPVVGIAVAPDGSGYWLVASDGGVFTFGVPFFGSTGSKKLNKPVIGILAVPDPATFAPMGYYLFASDGGVFTFNVPFLGALGDRKLNAPIVGLALTVDFLGYRLVATDGGVFDFNAPFFGSLGSFKLNSPIVGIAGT